MSIVQWHTVAKKVNFNTYDIHIVARVKFPWYIMSQQSSEEGPLPTIIIFEPNPNIIIKDSPLEQGNLKEHWNEHYNALIWSYTTAADFVQRIYIPNSVMKLKVQGKVFYTACSENECVPYQEYQFQIEI